jgi:predicted MFS family arabinose efflux permease
MMGAVESLGALCRAIGLPLGGALVVLSSPRTAFTIVGLGAIATTAVLMRLARERPATGAPEREGPSGAIVDGQADAGGV